MLEFNNVPLVPYTFLLGSPRGQSEHYGGPIWPNWDQQIEARFCRNNRPVDTLPSNTDNVLSNIGDVCWGGPIVSHFDYFDLVDHREIMRSASEEGAINECCTELTV